MPRRKDRDWKGVIASLLVHALILFLILGPVVGANDFTRPDVVGGGGPGPAGGGGGGMNGLGSREQRVEFVRVKSDPTTMPKVTPQTVPPVKPPEPKPPVESPVTPAQQVVSPELAASSTGEGTGNAGTPGAGPGTGGGVGSGEGTGRGSGVGPGTGGGPGKDYPPTVRDLFIPPMPAPQAVRGFHMKAFFDVDEKGNAKLIGFNATRDGDYNRRVSEVLRSMRFRPGVRADGTPKRDTAEIEIIF
jgi:protein TonB